jgi:hypothetical protein
MSMNDIDVKESPWTEVKKPQPKYCIRCVHYKGCKCFHTQNVALDLVTGELTFLNTPHELRGANVIGRCGKAGFWFEELPATDQLTGNEPSKKPKKSKKSELDECLKNITI